MKNIKIIIRRALCKSATTCIAIAPNIYALDNEFKAIVKTGKKISESEFHCEVGEEKLTTILAGARACPYNAIEVYDKGSGKKLYPPG
ncbi:MAG TPA: ferredoxin [bacterium]|jgi:ferredoxin|nr:ferredoxin [bacterium]